MKIAVIGSGISGMYAAWRLSKTHDVTVFEKNNYFGGHTDTHQLNIDGQKIAVDSGFIVFNAFNYPVFSEMLNQLGVESQHSNMSFSVNNLVSGLQYNPSRKRYLLARPQNFFNASFRVMLKDLIRFYQDNVNCDVSQIDADYTIDDYLNDHGYSQAFRDEHLYPMCGALWSCTGQSVAQIPYQFVIQFFQHHRMLSLKDRPQWQTVRGGSASYIQAIRAQCPSIFWKNVAVNSVKRSADQALLSTSAGDFVFDWVIFAIHADDTLKILADASELEREILGQFQYQDNHMVVHADTQIMPKQRSQWASWHVHVTANNEHDNGKISSALNDQETNSKRQNTSPIHFAYSYWMNNLQNLKCKTQIFSTLNPNQAIDPKKIFVERHYRHPVFDPAAIATQSRWHEINGKHRSSFCGAYWGWGFHEDGAKSALNVVNAIEAMCGQERAY